MNIAENKTIYGLTTRDFVNQIEINSTYHYGESKRYLNWADFILKQAGWEKLRSTPFEIKNDKEEFLSGRKASEVWENLTSKAVVEYNKIFNSEQFRTLLQIAKRRYKKLMSYVGQPAPGESHEEIEKYISYPKDRMTFNGDIWDIPRYTNGSTRHAKCLFRIGNDCVGDGAYPYIPGSISDYENQRLGSEYEKMLIQEYFDNNHVEIIWTWFWRNFTKEEQRYGTHYLSVGDFYIGIRVNGYITGLIKEEAFNK